MYILRYLLIEVIEMLSLFRFVNSVLVSHLTFGTILGGTALYNRESFSLKTDAWH